MSTLTTTLPDPFLSDPVGTIDHSLPVGTPDITHHPSHRGRHNTTVCPNASKPEPDNCPDPWNFRPVGPQSPYDNSRLWGCAECGHRARRNWFFYDKE